MSASAHMNEELHAMTIVALVQAACGELSNENFELLCMHCGVSVQDIPLYLESPTIRRQLGAEFIKEHQL